MKLFLRRMTLENFKGARHRVVDFGQETQISGRNGSGKSTLADAFFWVLCNKSSHGSAPGSSSFPEKPLDAAGQIIHNLDTTVELDCTLDGQPFTLRRTQRENWVKKRGQGEAVFSGNVSTYWINGVEKKAGEFQDAVAAICPDEKAFRYLTMLAAFNAADDATRRGLLLSMTGQDVDGELLSRPEYAPLSQELAERGITIGDLKKVLSDGKRMLENELRLIPARIDEARRTLPQFADYEVADAKTAVEQGEARLAALDQQIAAAMSRDGVALQAERLLDARRRLNALKAELAAAHQAKRSEAATRIIALENDCQTARRLLQTAQERCQGLSKRLEDLTARREQKLNAYRETYARMFTPAPMDEVCPACGQALPPEVRERVVTRQKRLFAEDRDKRLAEIQADGKAVTAEMEAVKAQLAAERENAESLSARAEESERACREAQAGLLPPEPDFAADPRYIPLTEEVAALEAARGADGVSPVEELRRQRAEEARRIDEAKEIILRYKAGRDTAARIAELEMRQRSLGDTVTRTEQRIFLTEQFLRDRCGLLEESINSRFCTVRYKLFDQLTNGGMREVCMCMVPGHTTDGQSALVDYGKAGEGGANTGAKMSADLEIISALQAHYGVRLPVFMDNRESLDAESYALLPREQLQLITLAVADTPFTAEIKA